MKEEIKKIDSMIEEFKKIMDTIYYARGKNINDRIVILSAMIIKKTIDILFMSKTALKNYIITVQISLLRLLCDNCLALESVLELGLVKYMDMINNKEQVNQIMLTEDQNMSDGYLKRQVSQKYPGFDKLYRFACEGVHFSKQTLGGVLKKDINDNLIIDVEAGNKELKDVIFSNNNSMMTICKVIIDMLKNIIKKEEKR